ncbi:MAG: hypothetical protein MRJ92_10425 [Nitrospira sp.]|nr:hypothetical protein [Nitrospira sp.]
MSGMWERGFIEQDERVVGTDGVRHRAQSFPENQPVHYVPVESIMSSPVISLMSVARSPKRPISRNITTRGICVKERRSPACLGLRDLLQPVSVDEFCSPPHRGSPSTVS